MAEKLTIRTDLAMESREMAHQGSSQELPGVVVDSVILKDIKITRVEVTSADGEQRIGKPVGNYITLEVPGIKDRDPEYEERVSKQLAEEIQRLVFPNFADPKGIVSQQIPYLSNLDGGWQPCCRGS